MINGDWDRYFFYPFVRFLISKHEIFYTRIRTDDVFFDFFGSVKHLLVLVHGLWHIWKVGYLESHNNLADDRCPCDTKKVLKF